MKGIWCGELELAGSAPALPAVPEPERYASARILVRLHGVPLGFVDLPLTADGLHAGTLLTAIGPTMLDGVNEHLTGDGLPAVVDLAGPLPPAGPACCSRRAPDVSVSVVVCTRNRAATLRTCLAGLRALDGEDLEILIVDNAPDDDSTLRAFVDETAGDARFRYVRERRPGLSCARNRGLREATGTVVAYTDDDVTVDPDWVRALVAPFAHPAVACTTGLVCTAAIDGPAERYFDARVSWADSLRTTEHRLGGESDDGIFPYATGRYGTGASFAVRAEEFRALGGFDEALGAGTATAGGEDIDAFVRVILAGHTLVYEPSAVVWHHHRDDLDGLRRQVYAYGTGTSAFITKQLLARSTRGGVLRRIPLGVRKVIGTARSTQVSLPDQHTDDSLRRPVRNDEVPSTSLLLRELAGLAAGPVLYARARRAIPPAAPVTGRA